MKIPAIVFLMCTFIGCSSSEQENIVERPNKLIKDSVFQSLLYELYLVEGMYYRNDVLKFNLDTLSEYHTKIFNRYEVSQKEFRASYNYYHSNPELMNKMYDEMISDYQILKSKIDLKEDDIDSEEGLVKDSLHAVEKPVKKTKPKMTNKTRVRKSSILKIKR